MCAQVVNFGNLHTDEVVGEVVEAEVTGVEYQSWASSAMSSKGRPSY